ncbi:aldo/keto reductase [Roseomonas sp. NAR14]|uniref:Aldo/keto reductase n=1 Tax=Roseomonas acroporae TaxID=2937791 RepID=A0A9X2BW99_9PROT|nr:aldo/keto reductase [Roseomonas acroporae]MCK8787558.1 aldo/keto reductase [Roseomonas acroporae]
MATIPSAAGASRFLIGGVLPVNRLGFGAMRLAGPGVWGPPADEAAALRLLRRLPELGIDFVDTADSYGPAVSEPLIGQAIGAREDVVVATKGGLLRPGPDRWVPCGRPEYLMQQVRMSLRHLRRDRIDLWQLHRIDPRVPRDEQFDAIRQMLADGLIRLAGLSEVSIEEIEAASRFFPVATVQNRFNLADRSHAGVLAHAEAKGIGFIPWFPLASGALSRPGSTLDAIAARHGATTAQVALSWLLRRSPVMLPIPGTSSLSHLESNLVAATLRLDDAELSSLEHQAA